MLRILVLLASPLVLFLSSCIVASSKESKIGMTLSQVMAIDGPLAARYGDDLGDEVWLESAYLALGRPFIRIVFNRAAWLRWEGATANGRILWSNKETEPTALDVRYDWSAIGGK